jgi:hypothetical protein
MAEAAIPRLAVRPGGYDRAFYGTLAFAMAAVVVAGFGPTFYFRPFFGAPITVSGTTTLSTLTIVHGLVFTAWVVLFPLQTTLIASRRVALHRRLGIGGAVLAAIMVVIGLRTALVGASRGAAPPGVDPLVFLAVPVFDMIAFAGFMTAASCSAPGRRRTSGSCCWPTPASSPPPPAGSARPPGPDRSLASGCR